MARKFTFRLSAEGVDELKRQLEALGPAGERAFDRLRQSSPQMQNALQAAERQIDQTRESLARLAASANDNFGRYAVSAGQARFQTAQLGLQLQDFFVQVQAGAPPLTAFIQQGSQVVSVYGGFRPTFRAAAAGVTSLTTATRALTASMLANPIFAVGGAVAAVSAAAAGYLLLRDRTDEAADSQMDYAEAVRIANEVTGRSVDLAKQAEEARRREALETINAQVAIERKTVAELEARRAALQEFAAELREMRVNIPGSENDQTLRDPLARVNEELAEARDRLADAESESKDLAAALEGGVGRSAGNAAGQVRTFADVLAELNEKARQQDVKDYADAIRLIERTVESGLTDQQRYERQVEALDRALELAASRGYRLSTEAQEALNRALRDADPAMRAARDAAQRLQQEQQRAAEQAAEEARRPFEHAADNIQDAFAATWRDIFRGGLTSFGDLADRIRDIFVNLAAEIAALMTVRPVLAGIGVLPGAAAGPGGVATSAGLGLISAQGINSAGGSAGFTRGEA